ncbi:MAG: TspO/MBR family protein [Candidatus Aenigmatarchaeota archaeon]
MKPRNLAVLLGFILLCQLAGIIGSFFSFDAIETWYAGLQKPFFTPPSWVFGPVWLTLYTLMGISAYLVWEKQGNGALGIFVVQLFLNAIWSIVFFGFHSPAAGVAVIIALWLAIAATMRGFWQISRTAAWLLVPYIFWVSFAALLNIAIMLLN